MRNVRFTDEVVKEFRRLVRNANLGNEFRSALEKVYNKGYLNGRQDFYNELQRNLARSKHDNKGASPSHNDDGVGVQSDSGIDGERAGVDAANTDSRGGSVAELKELLKEAKSI